MPQMTAAAKKIPNSFPVLSVTSVSCIWSMEFIFLSFSQ